MATTNLFSNPAFKDGAFTSNDRGVRRAAIGKAMRAIDLGGAWSARCSCSGAGARAPRSARQGPARRARALPRGDRRARRLLALPGLLDEFAIEPKPNEPRGDIFLPTVGHALHFITTLARPEMCGVNPEVAHETMAGLSFHHGVGQALWAGKLFHIDLNAQRIGRYDQDFRFGARTSRRPSTSCGCSSAPATRAAPLRRARLPQRGPDGVWEFAAGCMRTYLALAEAARGSTRCRRRRTRWRAAGRPGSPRRRSARTTPRDA
jgi:xylose isomerase